MQLEDYFDFLAPDDIRIKGSRIGIESVLYQYVHRGWSAKQIVRRYPTLTLEQVYATLLYYEHDTEKVGAYLEDYLEWQRKTRDEYFRNPPPFMVKLMELKAQKEAAREKRRLRRKAREQTRIPKAGANDTVSAG